MVAFLYFSNVFLKCLMEFIKVSYEISSSSESDVAIGVNEDGEVVALIDIEA